jgi:hypothetical protein
MSVEINLPASSATIPSTAEGVPPRATSVATRRRAACSYAARRLSVMSRATA